MDWSQIIDFNKGIGWFTFPGFRMPVSNSPTQ
jgi:hypothetical protein